MQSPLHVVIIVAICSSLMLLSIRPLISSVMKLPEYSSWNLVEEEEETSKKESSDKEAEQKVFYSYVLLNFTNLYSTFSLENYSNFIKIVHLSYPNPPPEA